MNGGQVISIFPLQRTVILVFHLKILFFLKINQKKHHNNEKQVNERAVSVIQASTEHREATTSANLVKKSELFMDDKITVKEFSEKM